MTPPFEASPSAQGPLQGPPPELGDTWQALPGAVTSGAVRLAAGETLYHMGDAAESTFFVTSGLLALALEGSSGRERLIDLAGPGDLIGTLSPDQGSYLDTATALGPDVSVVAVAGDALHAAGAQAPVQRAAARRLARLTEELGDADAPVVARLAKAFVRLAERFGQDSADGMVRLTLPLTHDTLAGLIGAARETTSVAVQELRALGLLAGTRGRYLVLPRALRDFARQAGAN